MDVPSTPERVLFQFPISHYCEKIRWQLDAKALPFVAHDVMPGLHVLTMWRRARIRTVPILIDRGTTIGDSVAIAEHIERRYPSPALVPHDQAARRRVNDLVAHFDQHAGPSVRAWGYGSMAARPGTIPRVFLASYRGWRRSVAQWAAKLLERAIKQRYRLDRERTDTARMQMLAALDRLEHEIDGDPSRYLVGGALSMADVTAASLFGPLVAPPGSPWERMFTIADIAEMNDLRDAVRRRPGGQWVTERYARDRVSLTTR